MRKLSKIILATAVTFGALTFNTLQADAATKFPGTIEVGYLTTKDNDYHVICKGKTDLKEIKVSQKGTKLKYNCSLNSGWKIDTKNSSLGNFGTAINGCNDQLYLEKSQKSITKKYKIVAYKKVKTETKTVKVNGKKVKKAVYKTTRVTKKITLTLKREKTFEDVKKQLQAINWQDGVDIRQMNDHAYQEVGKAMMFGDVSDYTKIDSARALTRSIAEA